MRTNINQSAMWIIKNTFVLFCVVFPGFLFGQATQVNINRVQRMPTMPSPYLMRDWKAIATAYDEFIFSNTATGPFLPVIHTRAVGVNYPALQPILLDTYVGSATMGNQAEAINIIPALVGATLAGIDKSNQNGVNWVEKSKDFFNKANGQLVYLNGYAATSGSDWWYDVMPNVFFYQLFSLYPDIPDFESQLETVASRWLSAVNAMGGSSTPWQFPAMNHRGWYLSTMTPNNEGVIEPETAGSIAWILYNAYTHTGEKKYLTGAQLAMEFLSSLDSNPSYELQLPYGAFIAAKMNAELGTQYPLEKIVNWCFDRSPLRGWGAVVGKWNGSDVSGLIGEANDAGDDYAFAMNGFQQAAALIPLVKYDKRYARDIARWVLNMANASRLYYPTFLPPSDQDDYDWSAVHDVNSLIGYEAIKELHNGIALYGTGDAKREGWSQTNLGVYGSSHVGYLGANIRPTDVDGILMLDVNKTDFFGGNVFPSYVIYNPFGETRQVTLTLGPQLYDIYDAISEAIIKTGVTGSTVIDINGNEAMLLVYMPAGAVTLEKNNRLYIGDDVVDYHVGYNFAGKFRLKSLDVLDTLVEFMEQVPVFATIENAPGPVVFSWYVNNVLTYSASTAGFAFDAPSIAGQYTVLLEVAFGQDIVRDSITLTVVDVVPSAPVIAGFVADRTWYTVGSEAHIICNASSELAGMLTYVWDLPTGMLIDQTDSLIRWNTPLSEGIFVVACDVTDSQGGTSSLQYEVLVKAEGDATTQPWAYYPLDGNVLDFSGNAHDAVLSGAQPTTDERGEQNKAYAFSTASDLIYVENDPGLNFQDMVTIAFWVRLDAVSQESFILSHGSWEERWKVSVTSDRKLRWTTKTTTGTRDLDSSFPLQLNQFYHVSVVYSGYSMELYLDGELDAFKSATGQLGMTTKALTFGKKDKSTTNYFLRGTLDEVRIYGSALPLNEIGTLKSLWNTTTDIKEGRSSVTVYPNPADGIVTLTAGSTIKSVEVMDLTGRRISARLDYSVDGTEATVEFIPSKGVVILKIETIESVSYRKIWVR